MNFSVKRRVKANPQPYILTHRDALDIARLCTVRMWAAFMSRGDDYEARKEHAADLQWLIDAGMIDTSRLPGVEYIYDIRNARRLAGNSPPEVQGTPELRT